MNRPAEVTVTRHRDALEGQALRVLGRLRRHGGTELLVVLPDGSKRMIPAAWTDDAPAGGGDGPVEAATLGGSVTCWPHACWFAGFWPASPARRGRLHGSHRSRRTTVQPVQLSLLPEQVPAPPWMMFPQLGEQHMTAAVTVLARLIAAAAASAGGDGDE